MEEETEAQNGAVLYAQNHSRSVAEPGQTQDPVFPFCSKHPLLQPQGAGSLPLSPQAGLWGWLSLSLSPPHPCRYLSHTELAPLRAPLIPMEHCTTRFFETCDLDNDKYIALDEWAGCFGIKESECLSKGSTVFSLPPRCSLYVCPSCPSLLCAWLTLSALPAWVGLTLLGDFLVLLYPPDCLFLPSEASVLTLCLALLWELSHLQETARVIRQRKSQGPASDGGGQSSQS